MKILPSDHWAQRVYFLDPSIIERALPQEPLPYLMYGQQMNGELLQFIIPAKHRPGTDKISKEILKDERIIDHIIKTVVGSRGENLYTTKESEWIDGKKADVVYAPVVKATDELPPILIEVQNTIDKSFVRRVIKYCGHLCDQYNIEPVVVILSIHPIPSQISNTFINTDNLPFELLPPLVAIDNAEHQFKRTLDAAADEDHPDIKNIKEFDLDGVRYTSTYTSKFLQQGSSDHQPQEILREIPITKREADKQWVQEFIDSYKSDNKKMNWKVCYELGLQEGYFKCYKNFQSLKSSYYNWPKN
ncbi:hypothetical protein INT45_011274 [Circinella minor]|uniref:Uncharacterized protein n=1 Tax=Circinella minor TaxID=1195481 RepID=A0A8H7RY96_9FUNG|nr:hypothetical protein INT45_011274 [Circinella minor]